MSILDCGAVCAFYMLLHVFNCGTHGKHVREKVNTKSDIYNCSLNELRRENIRVRDLRPSRPDTNRPE